MNTDRLVDVLARLDAIEKRLERLEPVRLRVPTMKEAMMRIWTAELPPSLRMSLKPIAKRKPRKLKK